MKLLKVGVVSLIALALVACQNTKPQSAQCEGVINAFNSTIKIKAEGNRVVKQILIQEIKLEQLTQGGNYTDEEVLKSLDEQVTEGNKINGLKLSYTHKDGVVEFKVDMDIKNGDLKKMSDVGYITLDKKALEKKADIGFKETVKLYESNNLTCQ